MSSSKIQEYNLDPNMGLAKEESVQEVKTVSDEIKALIGTEIATQLSTLQNNIITAIGYNSSGLSSCIRRIQRGTAFGGESVTLSGFTNLDKMVVLLSGETYYTTGSTPCGIYLNTLTTTKLDVSASYEGAKQTKWSYQVIEFY